MCRLPLLEIVEEDGHIGQVTVLVVVQVVDVLGHVLGKGSQLGPGVQQPKISGGRGIRVCVHYGERPWEVNLKIRVEAS